MSYVSRAGEKLTHALKIFDISSKELVCADFGSSTGGFADCLLQNGAAKVYTVDTGYGVLDWKLRNNPKVVVMERKNAMHINLPEKVDLITIDCSWTKLTKIISNAFKNLKSGGQIIALLKPHYEAEPWMLRSGQLKEEFFEEIIEKVETELISLGAKIINITESPLLGKRGKNKEYLLHIKPR